MLAPLWTIFDGNRQLQKIRARPAVTILKSVTYVGKMIPPPAR